MRQRVNSRERMLVNTTGNVDVLPTATVPNVRVEGLALAASRRVPVPSTGSSNFVFDPTSVSATFPPLHPIALGVKVTLRLKLCPGLRTSGRLNGDTLYSRSLVLTCETVTLLAPPLAKVTVKVSLLPTST